MDKKFVYVIDDNKCNEEQVALLTNIQGLVNSVNRELVFNTDHYLLYINTTKYDLVYLSYEEVLEKYLPCFDKYIVYKYDRMETQVDAAFSYSAASKILAIPDTLLNLVKNKECVEDLRKIYQNNIQIQKYVFEKFQDNWRKDGLIHMPFNKDNLMVKFRDYAIAHNWFCFRVGESKEDREFLDEVLSVLNKGIHIYGWTSDEISFVEQISKYGDTIIAMDWCCNHSFFGRFHPRTFNRNHIKTLIKPHKHYVCLCVSDGDNVQWLERDFTFSSFFGKRKIVRRDYPLTFSISPLLVDLNPKCLKYIYGEMINEDVVCGVSGYGYMNPCVFPSEYLPMFASKTNEYFKYADIQVNCMLDNLKYVDSDKFEQVLEEFSKQPNIIGTFYQMDPIRYEGGKGRVWWKNDKPFISVKYSFWNEWKNDDERKPNMEKLINSIATQVNNSVIDETSIEGYSLINVHPWSTTWADVDKLVSKFSDDIQVIGAEQFVNMIREKVKR